MKDAVCGLCHKPETEFINIRRTDVNDIVK